MRTRPFDHGTRIGKYEILARLAAGGMAELFLGVAAGPGGFRKFVVVKRILSTHRDDRDFIGMLLDEARITAALSHPNIAQVFDLGEDDGTFYLVMEFVAGQDVSAVRKAAARGNVAIPVGFAARVVRDVCVALDYAHHFIDPTGVPLQIIHRDLSPRNVMITYAGNVKVIDFGIAKARGMLDRSRHGLLKGSIGYMSPEQVRSEPLDGRSDLFSAGVLLYELITGEHLFRVKDDERATLDAILAKNVTSPHEVDARIPRALSDVVVRAVARARDARFATGTEMALAIEEAVGQALFNDRKVAAFMHDLFADRIEQTRYFLSLGASADPAAVVEAAAALGQRSAGQPIVSKTQTTQVPPESTSASVDRAAPSWRGPPSMERRDDPPVVLAVDDSNVGRKLAELNLTRAGFQVITCGSPVEALEMLGEMRPDVILLDVVMPGMDGFELCKRIREEYDRTIPVLFVSARCSLDERARCLEVGGDDFIRKPYQPAELTARVREHLRRVESVRRPAPVQEQGEG